VESIDEPMSTDRPENLDASLRRAAGLYRGLVEKLPGVTYPWGPAGRCTCVWPQVVEVFGCSEQAFGEGALPARAPIRPRYRSLRPATDQARLRLIASAAS
jgi:hypothetical protein